MKLIKEKKGFTLVELVVVIAILGILAGIAIPRFMEATKSARGAKIVADMRTIESATNIYYVKNGKYPAASTDFADIVNGGTWPKPPVGTFNIARVTGTAGVTSGTTSATSAYAYTASTTDADGTAGTVTLTGASDLSLAVTSTAPTVTQLLAGATS